jgi:hypothetical protein
MQALSKSSPGILKPETVGQCPGIKFSERIGHKKPALPRLSMGAKGKNTEDTMQSVFAPYF